MALDQMEVGYHTLLNRPIVSKTAGKNTVLGKDGCEHSRIVSLGGDHTIVLPILRALNRVYGQPISVIHFDSHLDTWPGYPGHDTEAARINHGTFLPSPNKKDSSQTQASTLVSAASWGGCWT